MTTWADAHARAAVLASQLHADLDLGLDKPIDVFAVVQQLGIVLAFDDLGGTSGLYLPAGDGRRHAGILLNSLHPRSRQHYTAAHELGHHVFGHSVEVDGDLEINTEDSLARGSTERWPDHEKEAEAFAAWFLMPRRLLRAGLAKQGVTVPRHPLDAYVLSLWLGTSYSATARQLGTTRLIDGAVANSWAELPPKQLKAALTEGLTLSSYRNDVWWLDERADGEPVDLRPGDRILLNLPEDPSTGYSWEIDTLPPTMTLVADSFIDDWEPRVSDVWMSAAEAPEPSSAEVAGAAVSRAIALDVTDSAEPGIYQLLLRYRRQWQDDSARSFELLVSVSRPLHGVQLAEDSFRMSA